MLKFVIIVNKSSWSLRVRFQTALESYLHFKALPVVCWAVWLRLPASIDSQWMFSRRSLSLCDPAFSLLDLFNIEQKLCPGIRGSITSRPVSKWSVLTVREANGLPTVGELWLLIFGYSEVWTAVLRNLNPWVESWFSDLLVLMILCPNTDRH